MEARGMGRGRGGETVRTVIPARHSRSVIAACREGFGPLQDSRMGGTARATAHCCE